MFVLASTFIFTAVGFFSLYRAYLRDASLVYLSLSYLLWVSYYWLHISFAIVVSSHTKSEGSVATGVEIHNAINHCNWPNVRKELKLYSLQLMHRCPNISCGLFPFDFTLFFSVRNFSLHLLKLLKLIENFLFIGCRRDYNVLSYFNSI